MTAPKLTKAQREALAVLSDGEWHDATESVFNRLTKLDYLALLKSMVECVPPQHMMGVATLRITDAGRAALKDGGK